MYYFAGMRKACLAFVKISHSFLCACSDSSGLIFCTCFHAARILSPRTLSIGLFLVVLSSAAGVLPGSAHAQSSSPAQSIDRAGRASAAAQLYQDARYDYSMGYINSAIRNLEQLIERYPYSPFAKQGRKDLKMLYASADRQVNRSNGRRREATTTRPTPTRGSISVLEERGAGRSQVIGNAGNELDIGGEDNEEDSLSRSFVGAPSKTANVYGSGAPTPATSVVRTSEQRNNAATISAVQGPRDAPVSPASPVSKISTQPSQLPAGKSNSRHGGSGRNDWLGRVNPASKSQSTQAQSISAKVAVLGNVAVTAPRAIVQLAPSKSQRIVKRRSAASIRRYNAAFKSASSDRIFFGQQSSGLGDRARNVIAAQARWLVGHDDLMVVVDGHADDGGTNRADVEMSRLRAQAVRDYLVSKGVDGGRIIINAYGRAKRIAICSTSDCAAQNRRVVTKITSR